MSGDQASYREILRPPGVPVLFAGSLVGRISFGMMPIGVVTLLGAVHGAFGVAGAAMGAYALGSVVSGPARSWWTVRVGHGRALLTFATISGAAMMLLPLAAAWTPWWAIGPAAVAGLAVPPFGALLRVGWAQRIPPEWVPRAFGLDAVVEESSFVLGPALAALVVWLASPATAVVVSGIACVAGGVVMSSAAGRARPDPATGTASMRSVLRRTAWLLVTFAGVGFTIGGLEVGIPAAAIASGHPDAAGLLFAAMAFASAGAALGYGRIHWRASPRTRLLIAAALLATATAATGLSGDLRLTTVLLLAVGLTLGPAVMTGYVLADQLVSGPGRTHSAILAGVACNAGAGLGAASAGLITSARDVGAAFVACALVTTALTVLGAVMSIAASRNQSADRHRSAAPASRA
ncbi:MFS transporter [Nocardia sp. NPDC058176]|uniref:MFS transporter n=1 Tax=Nocardia sp. NPDC058176 TaxID=3346368 RepID=UPI0036DBD764